MIVWFGWLMIYNEPDAGAKNITGLLIGGAQGPSGEAGAGDGYERSGDHWQADLFTDQPDWAD